MRLNNHQLAQVVEHQGGNVLVLVDESTGEEVVFERHDVARLRHAIGVLFPWDSQYTEEESLEDALEVPDDYDSYSH